MWVLDKLFSKQEIKDLAKRLKSIGSEYKEDFKNWIRSMIEQADNAINNSSIMDWAPNKPNIKVVWEAPKVVPVIKVKGNIPRNSLPELESWKVSNRNPLDERLQNY